MKKSLLDFSVYPVIFYLETTGRFSKRHDTETSTLETPLPDTLNGYVAFYRGRRLEVYAATSYAAQQEAARQFKARKTYDVTVVLAEKDGAPVTHIADF